LYYFGFGCPDAKIYWISHRELDDGRLAAASTSGWPTMVSAADSVVTELCRQDAAEVDAGWAVGRQHVQTLRRRGSAGRRLELRHRRPPGSVGGRARPSSRRHSPESRSRGGGGSVPELKCGERRPHMLLHLWWRRKDTSTRRR
jgi:hypothetical protein